MPLRKDDDVNLYAYVKNDALNATDPAGEDCQSADGSDAMLSTYVRNDPLNVIAALMSTDFLTHLRARSRLTDVAAERVRRVQLETSDRLAPVLLKLGLLSEADLAAEMAAYSGYPSIASDVTLQRADITELAVTDAFLRAHELVPIAKDDTGLAIACWDVLDDYAPKALAFACEVPIRWKVATQAQIQRAMMAWTRSR